MILHNTSPGLYEDASQAKTSGLLKSQWTEKSTWFKINLSLFLNFTPFRRNFFPFGIYASLWSLGDLAFFIDFIFSGTGKTPSLFQITNKLPQFAKIYTFKILMTNYSFLKCTKLFLKFECIHFYLILKCYWILLLQKVL